MALTATLYRIQIELSDVDRGVYQSLDVRLAQHPSESVAFLMTRAVAFALCSEEGLTFGRGLSTAEDPALLVRDLQGTLTTWIDVGSPAAERLHKASKLGARVVVFTTEVHQLLKRLARERPVHRAEDVELYELSADLLEALGRVTGRNARWELLRTDGQLYVTVDGRQYEGTVTRHMLPVS